MIYDAVIIGGGPCGISAALYIRNAGLTALVLHNNKSALLNARHIRNFYGYYDPENVGSGGDLYNLGLKQAEAIGADVINDEVFAVDYVGDFLVTGKNEQYTAKSVLLASGNEKIGLDIEGFDEYLNKGISFCAVCDAFFYKKKRVAVVGNSDYALHEANELAYTADSVTILTDGLEPEADFGNYNVIGSKIIKIYGDESLRGVEFDSGEKLELDGLFIAKGSAGSLTIARKMGLSLTESGDRIQTGECFRTSIEGFYAAGDSVNDMKQIASALYGGMTAGLDMIKHIRNKKSVKEETL